MLKRINELILSGQDFSFETTLSTKSFIKTIERARNNGYFITIIFFWLDSPELAKDRVRKRVSEGGHNIETAIIERRYKAGVKNLFHLYQSQTDYLLIYDNSTIDSELIAEKERNKKFQIHNFDKFNKIKSQSDEQY